MISVIFPAYNEEGNVAELHRRIAAELKRIGVPFEIVAVNNASTDRTYEELKKLSPVKIVTIAYNIGQTAGIDAGVHAAKGDTVVIMDADLQTDPADIGRMYAKLKEGFDAVVGFRERRDDSFGRRLFSRSANALARAVLGVRFKDYACPMKMFKKSFVEDLRLYGEMHVFLGAILHYRGANIAEVPVSHYARQSGMSKHTFIKGAKDIADLFTIRFLLSASRPFLLFGSLGLGSFSIAGLASFFSILLKLLGTHHFSETPLPVLASLFIILGVVLTMMGFLAELLIRVYYESRGATNYRIKEVIER